MKCLPDKGKFLQQIRYILKVSNVVRESFGFMGDSSTKFGSLLALWVTQAQN